MSLEVGINKKWKEVLKIIKHLNRWGVFTQVINITSDGCGTATVEVYDDNPTVAQIHTISVKKEKRGQGYGNRLLEACEKYAMKRKKVTTIELWADTKSEAYEWYKRHGYEPTCEFQVLSFDIFLIKLTKKLR